jgi:hypothetical protein
MGGLEEGVDIVPLYAPLLSRRKVLQFYYNRFDKKLLNYIESPAFEPQGAVTPLSF